MNELTREQILAMPAGRELDMLVATKVLAYVPAFNSLPEYPRVKHPEHERYSMPVEEYSTDISAAWEVVDNLEDISLRGYKTIGNETRYECRFILSHDEVVTAYSKTAPESICKAALLAVMGL